MRKPEKEVKGKMEVVYVVCQQCCGQAKAAGINLLTPEQIKKIPGGLVRFVTTTDVRMDRWPECPSCKGRMDIPLMVEGHAVHIIEG